MLNRLFLSRSLVFRLWLSINAIFLAAAILGTAVYVWTSVKENIHESQQEVAVRDQSLRVFSSMALRVLQVEGTFSFTDDDFEMLRNIGVYRMDLFNDAGMPILRINPWEETIILSPGYLEYVKTIPAGNARLVNGQPVELPAKTTLVPSIPAQSPSPERIAEVHAAGLVRKTVELTSTERGIEARSASMSPLEVLKGTDFGEELWVSRPGQIQQSYLAMPDLSRDAWALLLNASLVMLAVFITTSAGCWLLLRRLVYRPLRRLSRIAALIADGEPLRMPAAGHGEMVGLARAINDMADALESRATIDSLTGLYNHRHLTLELERLVSVSQHTMEPLSVIVADLNEFKQINDTFGHHAGDNVLCDVASILLEWAGGEFVCWRLGGDEFAAAMPGINKGRARFEAARLQRMIEGRTFNFAGGAARTSVAVGVACSPSDGTTTAELLSVADGAMYIRKDIRRGDASARTA
ncbi:MAG: GGDEF domain-containing protein [Dehalococcoidia bacterium]